MLAGGIGLLILLAGVLVYVLTAPRISWPNLNPPATGEGQSVGTPFGLTPFTDWSLSVGLCVIAAMVAAIVVRALWVRYASSTLRRLSAMIQPRYQRPAPRSLEDLVEQLIDANNRQYDAIMRRLEALERAEPPPSDDRAVVPRASRASTYRDEDQAPPRPEPAPAPRPEPVARAPEPVRSGADPLAVQRLEQAFRILLQEPSSAEFRNFFDTHDAVALEASAGRLVEGGGRSALIFALPVGRGVHLLFPGHEIASDFGSVYHAQRAMPDEVKLAFDLDIDGTRVFKLPAAAEALFEGGVCTLRRRGRLGGLTA